jgi:hypothetical protein
MPLKVPKCEIFDLLDSRDFYTGTVIKNSKLSRFGHDIKVFPQNFELAYVEHAQNIVREGARSKINIAYGCSEPLCKFQKRFCKIFTLWVFFTCFKNFAKLCFLPHALNASTFFNHMLSMRRKFVTACSACVEIFFVHAQHASKNNLHTRHVKLQQKSYNCRQTCPGAAQKL